MTTPSRADHGLPPACLERLQALLTDSARTVALEASLLEAFYQHCARQPAAANRRRMPLPLKSLLYRYSFLRPTVQADLAGYLAEQWLRFVAEDSATASVDRRAEPESPPDRDRSPDPPPPAVSAAPHTHALPGPSRDWFERFLDGVRILLFL